MSADDRSVPRGAPANSVSTLVRSFKAKLFTLFSNLYLLHISFVLKIYKIFICFFIHISVFASLYLFAALLCLI